MSGKNYKTSGKRPYNYNRQQESSGQDSGYGGYQQQQPRGYGKPQGYSKYRDEESGYDRPSENYNAYDRQQPRDGYQQQPRNNYQGKQSYDRPDHYQQRAPTQGYQKGGARPQTQQMGRPRYNDSYPTEKQQRPQKQYGESRPQQNQ